MSVGPWVCVCVQELARLGGGWEGEGWFCGFEDRVEGPKISGSFFWGGRVLFFFFYVFWCFCLVLVPVKLNPTSKTLHPGTLVRLTCNTTTGASVAVSQLNMFRGDADGADDVRVEGLGFRV